MTLIVQIQYLDISSRYIHNYLITNVAVEAFAAPACFIDVPLLL